MAEIRYEEDKIVLHTIPKPVDLSGLSSGEEEVPKEPVDES